MHWTPLKLLQLYVYVVLCVWAILSIPNHFWHPLEQSFVIALGAIGIWRYSWWFTHYFRAIYYERVKYPRLREAAHRLWAGGWRPPQLHILLTTYNENPTTTVQVIDAICAEVERQGIRTKLWVAYGFPVDRSTIQERLAGRWRHLGLQTALIQQSGAGKRIALGMMLRAMVREGLADEHLVVLMDGDSVLSEGTLAKCAALLGSRPDVQAVTTDEKAIVHGPEWVRTLLELRFTQRRVNMQSCAVSERVLTLTGRFSMFRAKLIAEREAIETLENDFLDHWLWGRFRFLSGDDKSTWYHLLKNDAPMLYLPDAMVATVEHIEGNGLERMLQNYRRWSGNMLRNGTRAIALGPSRMPFFIWWCLIDQRLSMWTGLFAPISALIATFLISPVFLLSFAMWVSISRLVLCLFLFRFTQTPDLRWPWLLYASQIINALTKINGLFRMAQQRWSNRGNQASSAGQGRVLAFRKGMALYLTSFYLLIVVFTLAILEQVIDLPGMYTVQSLLGR